MRERMAAVYTNIQRMPITASGTLLRFPIFDPFFGKPAAAQCLLSPSAFPKAACPFSFPHLATFVGGSEDGAEPRERGQT